MKPSQATLFLVGIGLVAQAIGSDFSVQVAAEGALFREEAAHPEQLQLSLEEQPDIAPAFVYPAILGEAEFDANPSSSIHLAIHASTRIDGYDERRHLFDLPEAKIGYSNGSFRARLGFDIESWGVMEYVNTSDVINQKDFLESFLSERKLGQPMLALTWISPLITWDAYALTFFRPMPLPGEKGRFRPGLRISENSLYESDVGRYQPEAALRASGRSGPIEFSAHYFHGYEREPILVSQIDINGPYLQPEYRMLHQMGADALWVAGDWLFKTENALRLYEVEGKICYAGSVGLERGITFLNLAELTGMSQLANLPWDITWYFEYLYDTRESRLVLPFTNHLFTGLRLALNDANASEAMVSYIHDSATELPAALLVELSLRPFERLKLVLGGAWLFPPSPDSPFAPLEQDSHIRMKVMLFW